MGATFVVADVANNFTGNFRARPHAGYKYFFNRNAAVDFSVGYSFDINEVQESGFFTQKRRREIDGRVGLSFVF